MAGLFAAIEAYERDLGTKLLAGLTSVPGVQIRGITDPKRFGERVPTVSFLHEKRSRLEVVDHLTWSNVFARHGNSYALPLTEALGVEPAGMTRVGLLHSNTASEVDALVAALRKLR